ncbi:MAG: ATP-binding protein [Betaproteobacteria bacterium]|nr:ATP-binding protein [Betaproteobacteria bacterium]
MLDVPPLPQHVSAAGAALSRILSENGATPDAAGLAELSAVELLSNIVRHGGPPTAIRVYVWRQQRAVSIAIADDGPPYDMSARPIALPADPLSESGRGLWIVKHAADRFRYRSCGGRNFHILSFFLGA